MSTPGTPDARPDTTGLREVDVRELRDGAAFRLPVLAGENAATVRGWVAACDQILEMLAAHPEPECNSCHDGRDLALGWECSGCGRNGDEEAKTPEPDTEDSNGDRSSSGEPDAGDVEALVAVVVGHQRIPLYNGGAGQRCTGCNSLHNETDGPNSPRHAAHVARTILASDWLANQRSAAREQGRAEGEAEWRAALGQWASQHEAVMDACVPMADRDERESGRRLVRRLQSLTADRTKALDVVKALAAREAGERIAATLEDCNRRQHGDGCLCDYCGAFSTAARIARADRTPDGGDQS